MENIKQQLEQDLKASLRSGEEVRKRTIRSVIAAIKNAEIDKGGALDDAGIIALIQKEIKSRRESIQDAEKANRADLAAESQSEIAILEPYLPKSLTDEELKEMVQAAIQETGAASPADMGKVMKVVIPRIQGRAANDRVSQTVRQLLQS